MSAATQDAQTGSHGLTILFAVGLALILGVCVLAAGEIAIIAVFGTIAFVVFLRYPVLGLHLTTVLLLVSGSIGQIGPLRVAVPVTAAKVCGFVTFLAWISNLLARRQPFRFNREMALLVLFFLWSAIGVFASPHWEEQWPDWFRLGTLLTYFLLAIHLLDTPKRIHTFVIVILLCGLGMATFAVVQYLTPALQLDVDTAIADMGVRAEGAYVDTESLTGSAAVRVSGGAGHSNWLAMIILIILPLNTYWFATAKSWRIKALSLLTAALEVVALILTFTRVGFLVGLTVLVILGVRHLFRWNPYRISAAAAAVVLAWFMLPSAYKERVLEPKQYATSSSVQSRIELQEAALRFTRERPVWGLGLGGYGYRLLEDNTRTAEHMRWIVEEAGWSPLFIGTHNLPLQILCETGVVGLGLLVTFFVVLLRDLGRARKQFVATGDKRMLYLTMALEVSLWSFLICGLFLHALQQKIWWMMAAIATVVPLYQVSAVEVRERVKARAPGVREPVTR